MLKQFLNFLSDRVLILNGSTLIVLEVMNGIDMFLKLGITLLVLIYTSIKLLDMYSKSRHNGIIRKAEKDKIFKELEEIKQNIKKGK